MAGNPNTSRRWLLPWPQLRSNECTSPDKIAEEWAVRELGMRKAKAGQRGHDGILPCGKKIEIKSKKYGAHSDSATYVDFSEAKVDG